MKSGGDQRWFWATLMLSCISIAAVVFAVWELLENRFFRDLDYLTLHYLYITRGIMSSLLLAAWAAWFVLRERRQGEDELHRSREHYRGLLEASPGAVALYDSGLRVAEWNAAAERLYGYAAREVIGTRLPTVPGDRQAEQEELLMRARERAGGVSIETFRRGRDGGVIPVQVQLLSYMEKGGEQYFLEVSEDIRDRIRLRQQLVQIERLTCMGQMAAGTAHHLNTPLAALLLRVQMMRGREHQGGCALDLENLEEGLKFCQQFVRRLLDFSRHGTVEKRPQEVRGTVESVLHFMAPTLLARRARVRLEVDEADGAAVLADASELETLLLILVSNAVDAVQPDGSIRVRCRKTPANSVEIVLADDGCGVAAQDLERVFEPFFTTKPPGKGTGLGLAIARKIVDDHGGSIHLESAHGQGTSATVRLPLCPSTVSLEQT
jgi:two-component system, NtrC family, sensor kinase